MTAPRKEIDDLDSLPYPDYEGFGLREYLELPPLTTVLRSDKQSSFVVGSRSCPYQCTFYFHTSGNKYRQRSTENILAEIKHLKEQYQITSISFVDELFARDISRVKPIAAQLKEWNISWGASFRVDDVNTELLDIIKNSTCYCMAFGIESADDTILTSMRKRITVAQIEKALKLCHNEAIPFTGILIFGDINETFASATNSLDFWEAHREYNLGLQFITTYPGSYLYKYAKKEGIIKNAARFLRDGCPMINVSKMTDDEISQIAKRIFTLSFNSQRQLESVHIKKLSRMSGISLTGICPYCGKEVIKEDVRMLVNCNWIACNNCGNKFLVGMVPEQIKEINASIENLLKRHAKIALWGITVHTLALFEKNDLYADKNIFFIDNSEMKQKLVIHKKPVLPPSILSSGEIEAVVFCYPNSFDMLRIQTLKEYLSINEFINILDLLEYDD